MSDRMTSNVVQFRHREKPVETQERQSFEATFKAVTRRRGLGQLAKDALKRARLDGLAYLETQNTATEQAAQTMTVAMLDRIVNKLMDKGLSREQVITEVERCFAERQKREVQ